METVPEAAEVMAGALELRTDVLDVAPPLDDTGAVPVGPDVGLPIDT